MQQLLSTRGCRARGGDWETSKTDASNSQAFHSSVLLASDSTQYGNLPWDVSFHYSRFFLVVFLLFHFGFLLLLLCSLVVCSWFSIFFVVAVGILVGENGGHTTNTQHTEEYSVGDCIAEYMATVEKEKIAFFPSSVQWRGWGSGRWGKNWRFGFREPLDSEKSQI